MRQLRVAAVELANTSLLERAGKKSRRHRHYFIGLTETAASGFGVARRHGGNPAGVAIRGSTWWIRMMRWLLRKPYFPQGRDVTESGAPRSVWL